VDGLLPATVLADEAFTPRALADALAARPYPIVHLAAHGVVAADPNESYILSYRERLTFDDLERLLKTGEFRDRPVELLVLSACSTAAGDDRAALGLAGIGIKAGARSVVASLWSVHDRATAAFVDRFYRALLQHPATKAIALQSAQRAMLAEGRFAHPGYWAPFLLIGNWL
jgi:CHAT domain-containing protein